MVQLQPIMTATVVVISKVLRPLTEKFKTDEKDVVKEEVRNVDSHYDPTSIIPIHYDR